MIKYHAKKLLLLILALLTAEMVSAQKKPVKKNVDISPIIRPLPESPKNTPSIMKVSVSEQEAKLEQERICTTCDTLVLELGKPHIVIYDVQSMADQERKIYNKQPDENDFRGHSVLRGLAKREWEELHRNFPEGEFRYHYVYRNTFIKVSNSAQQTINLLDRQEFHDGFLYWNGTPQAKALQGTKLILVTEQIAKVTGDSKVSSYLKDFRMDSLMIKKLSTAGKADVNIGPNMNALLQDLIVKTNILPFHFMNLKNVSSITIKPCEGNRLIFRFNNLGQLIEYIEGQDRSKVITYKDNLPFTILTDNRVEKQLFYQGNSISVKKSYAFESYKLIGKIFFKSVAYFMDKKNYDEMTLNSNWTYTIRVQNGETCTEGKYIENSSITCYSNNQWDLPLTISETYSNGSQENGFYTMPQKGNLLYEQNNGKEGNVYKRVYEIQDSVIKRITSTNNSREACICEVDYVFKKNN